MYRITVWHGEGKSLFYVVKETKTSLGEEWEVTHTAESRPMAEKYIEEMGG